MKKLTLENTKAELLEGYEELLSKVEMDDSYVKKTARNTKQEIFEEIEVVQKLVLVTIPFPDIEEEVQKALDNLVVTGEILGKFIDQKEKPDRRDRFIHKAIEDVEDAVHNIHLREGRKRKDDD